MIFGPDSPWCLVCQNRIQDAELTMKRLISDYEKVSQKKVVAMIIRTTHLEQEMSAGAICVQLRLSAEHGC
jgi:hypothetical protein